MSRSVSSAPWMFQLDRWQVFAHHHVRWQRRLRSLARLQVLHIRGIYYSCIVQLGNNVGTICFGPLRKCFHTYLLVSRLLLHWRLLRIRLSRIIARPAASPRLSRGALLQRPKGLQSSLLWPAEGSSPGCTCRQLCSAVWGCSCWIC